MPRPLSTGSGLRNQGQEVWGDAMKEEILSMVFEKDYVTILRGGGENAGGSWSDEYSPIGTVDGRIDNVGNAGGETANFGEQINERTTHILSMPAGTDATPSDRFEVEGRVWIATSRSVRTNEATTQLQVEELHG